MDEIWPNPNNNIDVAQVYEVERLAELEKGTWVTLNMISSIDGSITSGELSGGLSKGFNELGDKMVFQALRASADYILVGANTARIEKYDTPKVDNKTKARRLERGQAENPRLILISGSLNFNDGDRFLENKSLKEKSSQPIIYTGKNAPQEKMLELESRAEVRQLKTLTVDMKEVLKDFTDKKILLEGGPTLNGQMMKANLIDEICLTLSPIITNENGPEIFRNIVNNSESISNPNDGNDISGNSSFYNMELVRVLKDNDGMLFLRLLKK